MPQRSDPRYADRFPTKGMATAVCRDSEAVKRLLHNAQTGNETR